MYWFGYYLVLSYYVSVLVKWDYVIRSDSNKRVGGFRANHLFLHL